MKFNRTASAHWEGTGKEGQGSVSTQSTALNGTTLSFKTRFEQGVGTNPEELIGAAHAGCYTMQLSFLISEAGYVPTSLDTKARVFFEDGSIPKVELELTGVVPGISEADFTALANKAKDICPVSKLLTAEKVLTVHFKN